MNAAMHTVVMAFLFQTFDIKILNTNDIEVVDIRSERAYAGNRLVGS